MLPPPGRDLGNIRKQYPCRDETLSLIKPRDPSHASSILGSRPTVTARLHGWLLKRAASFPAKGLKLKTRASCPDLASVGAYTGNGGTGAAPIFAWELWKVLSYPKRMKVSLKAFILVYSGIEDKTHNTWEGPISSHSHWLIVSGVLLSKIFACKRKMCSHLP